MAIENIYKDVLSDLAPDLKERASILLGDVIIPLKDALRDTLGDEKISEIIKYMSFGGIGGMTNRLLYQCAAEALDQQTFAKIIGQYYHQLEIFFGGDDTGRINTATRQGMTNLTLYGGEQAFLLHEQGLKESLSFMGDPNSLIVQLPPDAEQTGKKIAKIVISDILWDRNFSPQELKNVFELIRSSQYSKYPFVTAYREYDAVRNLASAYVLYAGADGGDTSLVNVGIRSYNPVHNERGYQRAVLRLPGSDPEYFQIEPAPEGRRTISSIQRSESFLSGINFTTNFSSVLISGTIGNRSIRKQMHYRFKPPYSHFI